jgi:hypothetical protein
METHMTLIKKTLLGLSLLAVLALGTAAVATNGTTDDCSGCCYTSCTK